MKLEISFKDNYPTFLYALKKVRDLKRTCNLPKCQNWTDDQKTSLCNSCYSMLQENNRCTRCYTNYVLGSPGWCRECYENRAKETIPFHKPEEPFGVYSNWYPSVMQIGNYLLPNNEASIMLFKAILHQDWKIANEIYCEADPRKIKSLGRKVKNNYGEFDEKLWNEWKWEIMVLGLVFKFGQNQEMLGNFLRTGDKFFVEASSYDSVWGAGLSALDPNISDPGKIPGQNLLGKALMFVRSLFKFNSKQTEKLIIDIQNLF